MPLTPGDSANIAKAIAHAYGKLWIRQQALTHALCDACGLHLEEIEIQAAEWMETQPEDKALEPVHAFLELLRDLGFVSDPIDPRFRGL